MIRLPLTAGGLERAVQLKCFMASPLLLHAIACNAGDSFEMELYQPVPEVIRATMTP